MNQRTSELIRAKDVKVREGVGAVSNTSSVVIEKKERAGVGVVTSLSSANKLINEGTP